MKECVPEHKYTELSFTSGSPASITMLATMSFARILRIPFLTLSTLSTIRERRDTNLYAYQNQMIEYHFQTHIPQPQFTVLALFSGLKSWGESSTWRRRVIALLGTRPAKLISISESVLVSVVLLQCADAEPFRWRYLYRHIQAMSSQV